jgi:K+-sensing histidine kinase KdpD
MGMGLSICRSIVEAHGGRIWNCPRQPQGTTIHVSLPAAGPRNVDTDKVAVLSVDPVTTRANEECR